MANRWVPLPHPEKKPSGVYELQVVKDHYLSFQETIKVEDGKATNKKVTLEQNFGGLEVRSEPPGALIILDGKPTGQTTPQTFQALEPGIHTVNLTLNGYGEAVERANVRNKATERLSVVLQGKYGLLSIMSSYDDGKPCRGKVFIDGKEVGSTPLKTEVTATVTGGPCGVTDSCLSWSSCKDSSCDGCSSGGCYWPGEMQGPCSWYGPSSPVSDVSNGAFSVDFGSGSVIDTNIVYSDYLVRCVR